MPALCINDLPPAVLARVFALIDPRRDGLAVLLTCRQWLAVAEAECPQHLRGVVRLDAASPALQRLLVDRRALRRSFAKWAPYVSELGVSVPATLRPATASSTALVSSLPSLLRDVPGGTLRSLALTLTAGRRDMVSVCKAVARLTSLRHLACRWLSTLHCSSLDLRPLGQLSCLAQLERLQLQSEVRVHSLPPELLPTLGQLTWLDLEALGWGASDNHEVPLRFPDGLGAALREVRLVQLTIAAPAEGTAAPLNGPCHLQRLSMDQVMCRGAVWDILPQLTGLTALAINGAWGSGHAERPWPMLERCKHLVELDVCGMLSLPQCPPASLQRLTRLGLTLEDDWSLWRGLRLLRSLHLDRNDTGPVELPGLEDYYPELEELELEGFTLLDATFAAGRLRRLTRLAGCFLSFDVVLQPGPYLRSLRELSLAMEQGWGGVPRWGLPSNLARATSLERLDLSGSRRLQLRGAKDVALLCRLPRLRQVDLPLWEDGKKKAAAAVEEVRQGLLGAMRAGQKVSPARKVEVVIVRHAGYE